MREIWMMSNRQPWVEALLRGIIRRKSRSINVALPPVGSVVFFHASKTLWKGWEGLYLTNKIKDIKNLPRGGVCGVGQCIFTGLKDSDEYEALALPLNKTILPDEEYFMFDVYEWNPTKEEWQFLYSCLDDQIIVFDKIQRIPFISCRDSQVPTKKLPPELTKAIKKHPEWIK